MNWISENIASIILMGIVILIAFFAVRSKIKNRKKGCGSCAGCSGCAACSLAKKRQEMDHETK